MSDKKYEYTFYFDPKSIRQAIYKDLGLTIESLRFNGMELKVQIKADLDDNKINVLEGIIKSKLPHFAKAKKTKKEVK